jgi:hypothetical protein
MDRLSGNQTDEDHSFIHVKVGRGVEETEQGITKKKIRTLNSKGISAAAAGMGRKGGGVIEVIRTQTAKKNPP